MFLKLTGDKETGDGDIVQSLLVIVQAGEDIWLCAVKVHDIDTLEPCPRLHLEILCNNAHPVHQLLSHFDISGQMGFRLRPRCVAPLDVLPQSS